jgi:poly(hydroxyalkanoate) granule-associated protein
MPTKKKTTKEDERPSLPLFKASRRVLLAAVGAVALAQDEIEDFVNRLVERGEIAEKDGNSLVAEVIQRRKKVIDKIHSRSTNRVNEALERMNIPTRKDLEIRNTKLQDLTEKIDALKKDA